MKNKHYLPLSLLILSLHFIPVSMLAHPGMNPYTTEDGIVIPWKQAGFKNLENVLLIRVSGNGYADETILRFASWVTEDFDADYDSEKLIHPKIPGPSVYTKLHDGSKLSVNALPELDKDWYIPVYLKTVLPGTYLVEIEEIGTFDNSIHLYLNDYVSGILRNIKKTRHFYIDIPEQSNENSPSFEIYAGREIYTGVTDASCFGKADGKAIIKKKGSSRFSYTVNDLSGSVIRSGTASADSVVINELSAGNYLFSYRLKNGFTDTISFHIKEPAEIIADFSVNHFIIETGEALFCTNNSQNAALLTWDFGDGSLLEDNNEVVHRYSESGEYDITLTASSKNCYNSKKIHVSVTGTPLNIVNSSPRAVRDKVIITYAGDAINVYPGFVSPDQVMVKVYNLSGQTIETFTVNEFAGSSISINTGKWSPGMYIVLVTGEKEQFKGKILKTGSGIN